ncbi:MAG TPA: hypothetical protein ENK57_16515 [Polyangiaceae bacterium]|nr:hypothetical protein [Polyangiaceae bacterium]
MNAPWSWLCRFALIDPARIERKLAAFEAAGIVDPAPNPWQLTLGVLRMWHRVLFRSDTIGTCREHPVRRTWRARILAPRPLRFPFLLAERAVAPWDFSGLFSSSDRVVRHLLGAHHDGVQFVYDFELLAVDRDAVRRVRDEAAAVVDGRHPRTAWLRDLVVYDRYHENLLEAAEAALSGELELEPEQRDDPDLSLFGYLRWCARQPATPEDTLAAWRRGTFTLSSHPDALEEAACA